MTHIHKLIQKAMEQTNLIEIRMTLREIRSCVSAVEKKDRELNRLHSRIQKLAKEMWKP